MKKILITGANSYIGTSFENYIKVNYPDRYLIDTIDMLDSEWQNKCFSGYDCVFHVAGIAHSDCGSITAEEEAMYYRVNTDLAINTARKAKSEGAGQFIFMSSAIVYGDASPIGENKRITRATQVTPKNCYGDSKVRAEKGILALDDDCFRVAVIRSPVIYGKGSKGNYPLLSKMARTLPIFPYVNNQRSMLYIENLCEFVRLLIHYEDCGIFWPQNAEYINTSALVSMIAGAYGRRVCLLRGFQWPLKMMSRWTKLVNKAFGSMTYDMALSEYKENYRVCYLEESIRRTEVSK